MIRAHIFGSFGDYGSYFGSEYYFTLDSLRIKSDVPKMPSEFRLMGKFKKVIQEVDMYV